MILQNSWKSSLLLLIPTWTVCAQLILEYSGIHLQWFWAALMWHKSHYTIFEDKVVDVGRDGHNMFRCLPRLTVWSLLILQHKPVSGLKKYSGGDTSWENWSGQVVRKKPSRFGWRPVLGRQIGLSTIWISLQQFYLHHQFCLSELTISHDEEWNHHTWILDVD